MKTAPMIAVRAGGNPTSGVHLWLIHGLGDSSRNFHEAFTDIALAELGLFAPDLPGFGSSPPEPDGYSIPSVARRIREEIEARSPNASVVLLGHSIGGLIVTRIAAAMGGRIRGVVSVEGNLTRADTFFSSRALGYERGETFHREFVAEMAAKRATTPILDRYYESVRRADPVTFWALGRSAAVETGESAGGEAFAAPSQPTVYYWSTTSTPEVSRRLLDDRGIRQRSFEGMGHWPMLEDPERFYRELAEDVAAFSELAPAAHRRST